MGAAGSAKAEALPNVCQGKVMKTNATGAKIECLFADGTSILVSNFLASFIRAGDELLFPLGHEAAAAGTQIYIRKTHPEERRWDVFQAEIGYATQPRKDKRNNLFVSAEVPDSQLGISAISLRCEAWRGSFCVVNRRRGWDRQSSFYELLQVNPKMSPAELRLAFQFSTPQIPSPHPPTCHLPPHNPPFHIPPH